jgi:hypothetical protein
MGNNVAKAVVAYFESLSGHSYGRTAEIHDDTQGSLAEIRIGSLPNTNQRHQRLKLPAGLIIETEQIKMIRNVTVISSEFKTAIKRAPMFVNHKITTGAMLKS